MPKIEDINRLIEMMAELDEAIREVLKEKGLPPDIRKDMETGFYTRDIIRYKLEELKKLLE